MAVPIRAVGVQSIRCPTNGRFWDRVPASLMAVDGWILERQLFALMALQSLARSPSAKAKIRIDDAVGQQRCIAAGGMGLDGR